MPGSSPAQLQRNELGSAHFEDGFRLSDLKDIINIFLYFQFNLKLII